MRGDIMDISIVREPLAEFWDIVKVVKDDNSDEAWQRFVDGTEKFHDRIPRSRTPHEFEYNRLLYSALLEAGDIIGQLHRTESGKAS